MSKRNTTEGVVSQQTAYDGVHVSRNTANKNRNPLVCFSFGHGGECGSVFLFFSVYSWSPYRSFFGAVYGLEKISGWLTFSFFFIRTKRHRFFCVPCIGHRFFCVPCIGHPTSEFLRRGSLVITYIPYTTGYTTPPVIIF